eukprot:gene7592-11915_t
MSKNPQITKDFLQKFKKLDEKIQQYDEVETKIIQQQAYLHELEREVTEKTHILEKIREHELKEGKIVHDLKHLTIKSIFASLSGKKKSMLEKEEKEFLKAKHDEDVAEKNLFTIKTQFKSAKTDLQILQEKKKNLDELRREMIEHLNQVQIPIDPKLEENFKNSQTHLNKIVKVRMQYEQCSCHVDSAKSDLYSSILLLSRAGQENAYSMYDPFCYPGYLSDSWVFSDIGKAKNFVHSATIHLKIAQEILPNTLHVKNTEISSPDTLLYDAFFDDYYTEMMIEDNIETSINNVHKSLSSVENASNYLHKVLDNIAEDYKNTKREHEDNRSKIFNLKKKYLREALNNENPTISLSDLFVEYKHDEKDEKVYTPSDTF